MPYSQSIILWKGFLFMKYSLVFFDADNTLFDFTKSQEISFNESISHFKINYHSQALYSDYKQSNKNNVSQSLISDMFTGDYDIIEVDSLKNIMQKLNHTNIDLLKLDIEGAEISVLNQMLNDNIFPKYLLFQIQKEKLLLI